MALDWRLFIFKDQYGEFDLYGHRMTTTPKRYRKTDTYYGNDVCLHFSDKKGLYNYLLFALEVNYGTMSSTFSLYTNLTEDDYTFHEILVKHKNGIPQNELFGYDNEVITSCKLKKLLNVLDSAETW
jgi:hypothetical protein